MAQPEAFVAKVSQFLAPRQESKLPCDGKEDEHQAHVSKQSAVTAKTESPRHWIDKKSLYRSKQECEPNEKYELRQPRAFQCSAPVTSVTPILAILSGSLGDNVRCCGN